MRAAEPDAALGQWRPRPARGLLHGQHGRTRDPGLRLWHPLRSRAVSPGHQGRLAAGIPRALAVVRQPLGVRTARGGLRHRLRRPRRAGRLGRGALARGLAPRRDHPGGRLRHADRRLARPPRQSAAAVVGPRGRSAAPRHVQRRRPRRRAIAAGARRSHLQDPLSERRYARRAASFACGRSISSSRRRSRTWCAGTFTATAASRPCRNRRQSSSTTPIRASRSPS